MSDETSNTPQTPDVPEQPTVPQPVQPEQPAEPVVPQTPQPVMPEQPAQPAVPQAPQSAVPQTPQPTMPEQPAQPVQPTQPVMPEQPAQPAQPVQPAQPMPDPYAQQPAQPYGGAYGAAPGAPVYGQPVVQQPQNNGKAVGALVCGICSILFSGTIIISIILGIVAIVLAGQYIRDCGKDGKATGGKICGIVGIIFSVVCLVAYIAMFAIGIAALDYAYNNYDYDDLYEHTYSSSTYDSDSNSSSSSSSSATDADLDDDEQAVLDAAEAALLSIDDDSALVDTWASQADDLFTEATKGVSLSDIGIEPTEFIHWMAESVKVDSSDPVVTVFGDSAMILIDVESYDVPRFAMALIEAIPEDVSASSEEEAYEYLSQYAQEALDTTELAECTVSLDLVKEDDRWVVEEDSLNTAADLMFYLTED